MEDRKRLELISEAVRYCQRVRSLGMSSSCYSKALREPVHFLWERRAGPKFKVAKFRSRAALGVSAGQGKLVYDHAVPFRYLQAELLSLAEVTPETVEPVLNRYGVVVIITSEDDALLSAAGYAHRMPKDWNGLDPLARYKAVGLELVENR